mmetsp:Transcript_18137/g.72611  ORF Transcript_18137/g.72611 Transcript_18137/m.72611 type:complete len:102 (-) Transcript_18137:3641-3946(-)
MWSLCRTGFQVQVRDGFGVNSGRGRLRVCGRARSRVGMVKKGGRRFQSNPVDFGVVGVEDEDGTLLFDDLKDLGEGVRVGRMAWMRNRVGQFLEISFVLVV